MSAGRESEQHASSRILTMCQGWDSSYGGIATVNRELSIGLAELGHAVTARVSHGGEPHPLVDISVAAQVPGIEDDRAYLLNPIGLPAHADVVIGHSRFSGGPAAVVREAHYPRAALIHFVHMSPELLGRLQKHPDLADRNATNERRLIGQADLVVAVGPLLAEEARRMARQTGERPPPVHELIPGVVAHPQPAYSHQLPRQLHLLLFGRAFEPLKGAANAARITRALTERGWDVQLTVRGATAAERPQQEEELSDIAGRPVWVKPFTADQTEVDHDLRGTDLVLVASEHEDFGLVATEAAGHGVPLLVGAHTGVGMFFSDPRRVPPDLGAASVVPESSRNTTLWADRVAAALDNLHAERRRALGLQRHLAANYPWRGAGAAMMEALAAARPPTGRDAFHARLAQAGIGFSASAGRTAGSPTPGRAPGAAGSSRQSERDQGFEH